MSTIGEILADLREDKGITQTELAEIIGVARNTISSYENDAFIPDSNKLIPLAKLFDVSVDYLLGLCRSSISVHYLDMDYCKYENEIIISGDILKRAINLKPETRKMLIEYIDFLEGKYKKSKK